MEPMKQLNQALRYIEDNLTGEIDYKKASQIACCSEYHFRRMFSSLSGLSLSEYIRRRRLAQAALEFCSSNIKVIDLALKYGYDSPDAFTRAFQTLHGATPSEVKRTGAPLKAIPPMSFQLTLKGANEMDYRIIEKESFNITGIMKKVSLQYNGVNPEIAAMWDSLTWDDIIDLKKLCDVEPMGLLSASINFSEGRTEGSRLEQYIGVATSRPHHEKWQVLTVPASTWAIFTSIGKFPDTLQNIWGRIYAEWFPMSGYEINRGPEILWNESKDTSLPDYHSEIWIPVIKR